MMSAAIPRVCNATTQDGVCGYDAKIHVTWNQGEPDSTSLCRGHWVILKKATHYQVHDLGPDCGMPGSYWDEDDNRCIVPGDLFEAVDAEIKGLLERLAPALSALHNALEGPRPKE